MASAAIALGCGVVPAFAQSAGSAGAADRASQVRHAIVESVKTRMGADAVVRVESLQIGGVAGAGGGALVATPEPGARLGRAIRFSLARAAAAGRAVPDGHAVAQVFVEVAHARAARRIARGETCAVEDLLAASSEVGTVLLQRLPREAEIAGARAVRDVMPGEVLTRALVAARSAVRSGDVVRLRASSDGVRVETRAVATQSGDPGETIRVVNRDSRRTVRARVIGPGEVEVLQ